MAALAKITTESKKKKLVFFFRSSLGAGAFLGMKDGVIGGIF